LRPASTLLLVYIIFYLPYCCGDPPDRKELDMEHDIVDQTPGEDSDLLDLGSVSEETKGRFRQPFEFGVSPTSRDEAG